METTKVCDHTKLVITPADRAANNLALAILKQQYEVGDEDIEFGRRNTCLICEEHVFIKEFLRRKK
jgi:hypothetical protein